ncbi:MAG: TIGR00730 family Rossman fold protein [Planctomycetota bacterium]|nr:MAG: TIGR00730 family Rossman fold protein [Planctomycetota bacterium]
MKSICVYCGSSIGSSPSLAAAARELGQTLAASNLELIYGGGRVGLMGVLADAVLEAGGRVQGVIPQALADREVAHAGLTQLHVVDTMHQRKAMMAELSDGFIALPGGLGTFEELFEIWTWAQLGMHSKPIGLLNVASYFDLLLQFLDHATSQQLLKPVHRDLLLISNCPDALLSQMQSAAPVNTPKWIDASQT